MRETTLESPGNREDAASAVGGAGTAYGFDLRKAWGALSPQLGNTRPWKSWDPHIGSQVAIPLTGGARRRGLYLRD